VTGDENNGQLHRTTGQFLLQLQSAQARELDIQHQTAGGRWPLAGQKLVGGGKCPDVEPRGTEQIAQTLAHGPVVINDKDAWVVFLHGCTSWRSLTSCTAPTRQALGITTV
jgi:hypothetical protein